MFSVVTGLNYRQPSLASVTFFFFFGVGGAGTLNVYCLTGKLQKKSYVPEPCVKVQMAKKTNMSFVLEPKKRQKFCTKVETC